MGLLGHALVRAAGAESFPALVEDRVLEHLGMTMTAYGRPEALSPWMTRGHDEDDKVVPYWDVAVLSGAGGLNSTATDMLTYLDANIGEPTSPSERAMRDAHVPRRQGPVEVVSLALSWAPHDHEGQTVLSHSDGTAGYNTYIGFDPERGAGVAVLANSGDFDADELGLDLLLNRDQ